MTFCIRKATRIDKGAIALVYAACFEEVWAAAAVDDLLKGKGCWAFILEATSVDKNILPAGFVMGRSVLDEVEILSIGIDPNFLRRGFAWQLMQSAIEEAKVRNGATIYLEVAEDNHPARALYKRLGFDAIGRRKGYYLKADRSRVDAINLSLKLHR